MSEQSKSMRATKSVQKKYVIHSHNEIHLSLNKKSHNNFTCGCTAIAVSPNNVSGLVVAMVRKSFLHR